MFDCKKAMKKNQDYYYLNLFDKFKLILFQIKLSEYLLYKYSIYYFQDTK